MTLSLDAPPLSEAPRTLEGVVAPPNDVAHSAARDVAVAESLLAWAENFLSTSETRTRTVRNAKRRLGASAILFLAAGVANVFTSLEPMWLIFAGVCAGAFFTVDELFRFLEARRSLEVDPSFLGRLREILERPEWLEAEHDASILGGMSLRLRRQRALDWIRFLAPPTR
jgi:hypothetical protein